MKKLFLFATLLFLPLSASAVSFQVGENVDVEPDGNAYAAGSVVQVSSEVRGDVYLIGETVQVNERIHEDALFVGQNVTINAPIGDDLHAFGSTILLNEDVGGDAILFGQRIILSSDVQITGTAIIGGEDVFVDGRFDDDVRLMAADLVLRGTFNGDVKINAGSSVEISEDTVIRGNLYLAIPEGLSVVIPENVVRGEVDKKFHSKGGEKRMFGRLLGGFRFFSFLSSLFIGGILIAFARTFAVQYGEGTRKNFWKLLLIGFLGLIVPPCIAFLLFLPVITIPLAILVLIAWGTFLFVGSLLSGLVVANVFFPLKKSETLFHVFGKFALGTFLLSFVRIIPFFGFLIVVIFSLLSYGSLIAFQRNAGEALRKAKLL